MTGFIKILFVCSKNISLSPMAAQIFLEMLKKKKIAEHFSVDSAAIDFRADTGLWLEPGAKDCLVKAGIDVGEHTSRLLEASEAENYDWIICMSAKWRRRCFDIFQNNAVYVTPRDVRRVFKMDPSSPFSFNGMVKPRVCCLMDFTEDPHDIIDPADTGENDWRFAYRELSEGCSALVSLSPFVLSR